MNPNSILKVVVQQAASADSSKVVFRILIPDMNPHVTGQMSTLNSCRLLMQNALKTLKTDLKKKHLFLLSFTKKKNQRPQHAIAKTINACGQTKRVPMVILPYTAAVVSMPQCLNHEFVLRTRFF